MMKRILSTERLRKLPACGFSWLDRRFMHEFATTLNRDAVYLYLFLVAVSDKHGLSYYKTSTIQERTGIGLSEISRAREELLYRDLIAYEAPLYQVMALPVHEVISSRPLSLGELMAGIALHTSEGVKQ